MRCLVMKPASLDIGVLGEILSETSYLDVLFTSDVGAGIDLAQVEALDEIHCGIAVVPAESSNNGARVAIFVEIGIATARGVPVLVIVDPAEPPLPALGDLMVIRTGLDNKAALRLHVPLFLQSADPSRVSNQSPDSKSGIASQESSILIQGPPGRGKSETIANIIKEHRESGSILIAGSARYEGRIARVLDELLTARGAIVQREVRQKGVGVIDIAFTHPQIRETVLVEVRETETGSSIDSYREQLYRYVRSNSQSIGFLLFSEASPEPIPAVSPDFPLIWAMSIGEFYNQVSEQELGEFLRRTRNQLVHG